MREGDPGAAEPGQSAQVQGTDEAAGMMLEGGLALDVQAFLFCPNFVRILSQFWKGPEALKNKGFSNFVLFVLFVPTSD